MSNMHRIHWFDEQIRSGRYPNSSLLAREFEISRRQAQRDIEYMAATLRAPLVYMAKYRGYCYEDQTYRLPQLYMTEEEQRVLKYLAHRYRHYDYDRSDAVKRVAHLLERFTEEDSESEGIQEAFPSFSAAPRQLQYRELLSHAIKESRVVHMHYQDHEGERQFPFCPLGFVSRFNADYVAGYETDPLQNMLLRLEGVRRIRLSDERFVCDAAANQSIWERPLPVRKPLWLKSFCSKSATRICGWDTVFGNERIGFIPLNFMMPIHSKSICSQANGKNCLPQNGSGSGFRTILHVWRPDWTGRTEVESVVKVRGARIGRCYITRPEHEAGIQILHGQFACRIDPCGIVPWAKVCIIWLYRHGIQVIHP